MPRIAGVDIPENKRVLISLTYIYGIGKKISQDILQKANIDSSVKTSQLTDDDVSRIRQLIENEYLVEGNLELKFKIILKGYRKLYLIGALDTEKNYHVEDKEQNQMLEHEEVRRG